MKKVITIFVIIIVVIVALYLIARPDRTASDPIAKEAVAQTLTSDEGEEEAGYIQQGVQRAGTSAPLIEFDQADYEYALSQGKKIALLFFADWCPTCRNEIANEVIPAFNQLERDDVVGFLVNTNDRRTDDFEDGLAREFQVQGRHVKVFLDSDGSMISKSAPENWTTERYLETLNEL